MKFLTLCFCLKICSPKVIRLPLRPTQLPSQRITGSFYGGKGPQASRLRRGTTKSLPPYTFMVCTEKVFTLAYIPLRLFQIVPHDTLSISIYTVFRGLQIFDNCRGHIDIIGSRTVNRSKFITDYAQILCATAKNLVGMATWQPRIVHS